MVIGLCGYKGSGKSEVAKYIAENYKFKRLNFKDPLLKEVKEKFPDLLNAIIHMMDKTEYDGNNPWTVDRLFTSKPLLSRTLLQNYGTNVVRSLDEDHWVSIYLDSIDGMSGINVVTDDVRFTNELDAIRSVGGILIRVVRDDITSGGTHISETEQESFEADFTIGARHGNLAGLFSQVDGIMNHISVD